MNLIAIVIIAGLVTALLIKNHKAAPALVSGVVTLVLLFAAFPTLGPAVSAAPASSPTSSAPPPTALPTSRRGRCSDDPRPRHRAAEAIRSANHATGRGSSTAEVCASPSLPRSPLPDRCVGPDRSAPRRPRHRPPAPLPRHGHLSDARGLVDASPATARPTPSAPPASED